MLIGGVDFEPVNSEEFIQAFISGSDNGTLCLTSIALTDNIVEPPEFYEVLLNSTDEAIHFTIDLVQIVIEDASQGTFFVKNDDSCIIIVNVTRCVPGKFSQRQLYVNGI